MHLRNVLVQLALPLALLAVAFAASGNGKPDTIKGYVLDSACAFTKNLKKPISPECAVACAKAGSPLVILSDDGTIYWPISDATPSSGQNDETPSICRPEGHGHGEGFRERWIPCRGHRQDRIHGECKVERIMAPVCSVTMRRADTVVYKFPYGEDE